ncbi:MAG: tetratricopeptide repeat protein [Caldilineales bacterium]
MVDEDDRSAADPHYAELFRRYIDRSLQAALADLQARSGPLAEDSRDQALHVLEFALTLPDFWPASGELLLVLAPKLEQAGQYPRVLPLLQRSVALCRGPADWAMQAELELHQAQALMALGDLSAAQAGLAASVQHAQAAGDPTRQAAALNRWAYLDHLQCRPTQAQARLTQALALIEPNQDEIIYARFVQGMVALAARDWSSALLHLQAALQGWQQRGDAVRYARSLTNLGTAYGGAGRRAEAITCYQQAINEMQTLGDIVNAAATHMNLGNLYNESGDVVRALAHYSQAEPVLRAVRDQVRLARLNVNLGLAYSRGGQWPNALTTLQTAVDYYLDLGDPRGAANALDALAEVHLLRGDKEAALPPLHQAKSLLADYSSAAGYAPLLADIERHLAQAGSKVAEQDQVGQPVSSHEAA